MRYTGCMVNGYRFHTEDRERERKTQNSGVVVKGEHGNNAIDFYGVLKDIIEVRYFQGNKRVVLFKCDWWNVGDNSGMHIDKDWKIISVNLSRKWYHDQPYVLANQVRQVYYLPDLKLGKNWHVVETFSPRNYYDVPEQLDKEQVQQVYQEEGSEEIHVIRELDQTMSLTREATVPLKTVDASVIYAEGSRNSTQSADDEFINDDEDMDVDPTANIDEDEDLWIDFDSDSE